MFFEVEDYRPDTPNMPRALTPLEAILLTLLAYAFIVIVYLIMPARWFQQTFPVAPEEPQQIETFVAMPRMDHIPKLHTAAASQPAAKPENPLPKAQAPVDQAIAAPEDKPKSPEPPAPSPAMRPVTPLTDTTMPTPDTPPAAGGLASSMKNLSKYLQDQSFNNPQGGGGQDLSEDGLDFDAKGVDFGPWIRRFIATVKHNWNVPQLAQMLKGHVVITFNVHKDGRITDITVIKPAAVDSFNLAAKNALLTSNPTMPIPKEYPTDPCFFTVTFYYNERPPIK